MAEELITEFKVTYYEHPKAGKLAIMTMDNGADYKKPNTFGAGALASLNQAMDNLDKDIKGLLLTGKTFIFSVGADLMKKHEIKTREDAVESGRGGHAAFKRIMDLGVPTLAAVNGAAIGGGVEISLYCDYRTISTGVTAYAFPECFLGLVPGWGGTQLVPRLIGPDKALTLIVRNPLQNNRMINGKKAFEMGLADRLFEPVEFFDESINLLAGIVTGDVKIEREKPDFSGLDEVIASTREFVVGRVHSGAIASYRALDLVKGSAEWSLDDGFEQESQALGDLIISNQVRASVYSFDLAQRRAKQMVGIPDVQPLQVNKVGVIGAGLMASQLAVLFLRRLEGPVVMKDIKQKVFGAVEKYVSDTAVLATYITALSTTEMAKDLKHPERVIGFHFFNPVAVLPLLEIIKGKKTNEVTTSTAGAVAKKIKKTIVVMNDAPPS